MKKVWSNLKKEEITKDILIKTIYKRQKRSSKIRGHKLPDYTLEQFSDWMFSQNSFDRLFKEWIESGCSTWKIPSVDRISDYKSYTLNNIQLMTWEENKVKGEKMRAKGLSPTRQSQEVHQFTLEGIYINTFHSARSASLQLTNKGNEVNSGHILEVCRNERHHCLNYLWSFDREGRDIPNKVKYFSEPIKKVEIVALNKDNSFYKQYPSLAEACRGIPSLYQANISKVLSKKRVTAGGYKWMYLKDYLSKTVQEIDDKEPILETKQVKPSQIYYNEETCLVTIQ